MRLIDADRLHLVNMVYDSEASRIIHQINKAPTVDAEPVIRCKDCKFATITDGVYSRNPEVKYCDIWFPNEAEYMPINYYCASAERKEKCD